MSKNKHVTREVTLSQALALTYHSNKVIVVFTKVIEEKLAFIPNRDLKTQLPSSVRTNCFMLC